MTEVHEPASLTAIDPFVVIATAGRSEALAPLLRLLSAQTLPPKGVVIVGAWPSDTAGIDEADYSQLALKILYADQPGLPRQRNVGVAHFTALAKGPDKPRYALFFFDDDFRPGPVWIEKAVERLRRNDIAGVTGKVLQDGVVTGAVTEGEAESLLASSAARGGETEEVVASAYGCNMAFMDRCVEGVSFDENLPLYGWLEDRLFSKEVSRIFGPIILCRDCCGVHLGNPNGGRARGVRLGYSQIANPLYLHGRGAMSNRELLYYAGRALASNVVKTVSGDRRNDYPGRMKGNLTAIGDLCLGRISPRRILEL